MARVWIWLLLFGVGLLHLHALVVAATVTPSPHSRGIQISAAIAKRFVDPIRGHHFPFLGNAELDALEREIAAFASHYAPEAMPPCELDALLEAVERYVDKQYGSSAGVSEISRISRSWALEGAYLELPDLVDTFKWRLWRALTREPLTPEQQAKRQEQHDWLRKFIAGVPPRPRYGNSARVWPEDPNAWGRAYVERELADPLSLWHEPFTDPQFETFTALMRCYARNGLKSTVRDIPPAALAARSHRDVRVREPYAPPFDVALPFDDEVISVGGSRSGGLLLGFASNAQFRGQFVGLDGHRRPILAVVKDAARALCGKPRRGAGQGSQPRRIHDITYDHKSAKLMALDGARMAELKVADWFEADRLSNAELARAVKGRGTKTLSVKRLPTDNDPRGYVINPPRFFIVVRNRAGRLAVADLLHRDFGNLTMLIRERSTDPAQ